MDSARIWEKKPDIMLKTDLDAYLSEAAYHKSRSSGIILMTLKDLFDKTQ